jgi:CHAT domain-containing protein
MCFFVMVSPPHAVIYVPWVQELAYVPFAALKLEDEYLIKRHLVAVSMSVRAYANSERRYAGMEVWTDLPRADVLVISNPFPVDSPERMGLLTPYQRLEALRQAELEGQMIAGCMQVKVKALRVHHLRGHHAKKLAVMKVLPKAAWVHFACHGFVSEKYPLGALLLGKTIKPMWLRCLVAIIAYLCTWLGAQLPSFLYRRAGAPDSVGILGAEEVLQSVMQAHCVVLNVCNSAQGKVTVDGLFNWSHALQQVGVPSAILCLWEVQDSAACKFMSILYNHLTNKLPLGLAMQKAMITFIDDGDNWEPKHWASYSLVGVPHVQLPGFR